MLLGTWHDEQAPASSIIIHMQERLAKFMGTEESIIYSYDLATVPSVLPAFANAKDVIVCDEVLLHEGSP